jgi:hypothetical protein
MNIIESLENKVNSAKARSYFTGTEIAKETVQDIKRDGFSVFEVTKTNYSGKTGNINDVKADIFMTRESAVEYAKGEATRLCNANNSFEQYDDGKNFIEEIEIEKNYKGEDTVVYRLNIKEKAVN